MVAMIGYALTKKTARIRPHSLTSEGHPKVDAMPSPLDIIARGPIASKQIMKHLGGNQACLFGIIVDVKNRIGKDFFFYQQRYFLERLNVSQKTLQRLLKQLVEEELIIVKRVAGGTDTKNYYGLNDKGILRFLKKYSQTPRGQNDRGTRGQNDRANANRPQNANQTLSSSSTKKNLPRRKRRGDRTASLFKGKPSDLLAYWVDANLRQPMKDNTKKKALNAFHQILQRYPKGQIEKAINVYVELINGPYNRVAKNSTLWFSADEFFSPTAHTQTILRKNFPVVHDHGSMFDICKEGLDYAQEQLSAVKKSDNPAMAKLVRKYAEQYTGMTITPKKLSDINRLADMLTDFWKRNKGRFSGHSVRNLSVSKTPNPIVKIYFDYLKDDIAMFDGEYKFFWIATEQQVEGFGDHLYHKGQLERRKMRRNPDAPTTRSQDRQYNRKRHSDRPDHKQRRSSSSGGISERRRI